MLSRFCTLALLTATLGVQAADTSVDEARIDALVTKINEANRATQVPSLYGEEPENLVADAPAAVSSGTESIAVPLDEEPAGDVTDPGAEGDPAASDPAVAVSDVPVSDEPAAPASGEIARGPVTFEQLGKLINRRIRVSTLSGRRYEGDLTAVTDVECRVSVRMYGTGVTVMPIKKAHISAIELL